jgi:uncharacterized membrane protein YfcA
MGIFFLFAAGMALIAGITLLFTGAYSRLFPLRAVIGPLFLLLSALLIATAIGWFRRRKWGWTCALIIMALQLLGDFVNILVGEFVKGALGIAVVTVLLFYLLRRSTRRAFSSRG